MAKRTLGGVSLIVVALFFSKEAVIWGFGKFLDYFVNQMRGVTLATFPWSNLLAFIFFIAGIWLIWSDHRDRKARPSLQQKLVSRGAQVVARLRRLQDPLRGKYSDVVAILIEAEAATVMFQKAGYSVPTVDTVDHQAAAAEFLYYFENVVPYIRDGHLVEAATKAAAISHQ